MNQVTTLFSSNEFGSGGDFACNWWCVNFNDEADAKTNFNKDEIGGI